MKPQTPNIKYQTCRNQSIQRHQDAAWRRRQTLRYKMMQLPSQPGTQGAGGYHFALRVHTILRTYATASMSCASWADFCARCNHPTLRRLRQSRHRHRHWRQRHSAATTLPQRWRHERWRWRCGRGSGGGRRHSRFNHGLDGLSMDKPWVFHLHA